MLTVDPKDVAFVLDNKDGTATVGIHLLGGIIKPQLMPASEAKTLADAMVTMDKARNEFEKKNGRLPGTEGEYAKILEETEAQRMIQRAVISTER